MFPSLFLGLPDRDRDRDRDSALPFLSPVSSLGSADLERDRRGLRDRDRDLTKRKRKKKSVFENEIDHIPKMDHNHKMDQNTKNESKSIKWIKIHEMDQNP